MNANAVVYYLLTVKCLAEVFLYRNLLATYITALVHSSSPTGAIHGHGGGPCVVLHGYTQHLQRYLHQRLTVVREHEMVVGHAVPHRVVRAQAVQQRREQGQGMSGMNGNTDTYIYTVLTHFCLTITLLALNLLFSDNNNSI